MRVSRPSTAAGLALVAAAALVAGCGAAAHRADPPPRTTAPAPALHAVLERHARVRSGVVALAVSDGDLWVSGFGLVSRIDPATGRVMATIATGTGDFAQMAVGDGSIWVTDAARVPSAAKHTGAPDPVAVDRIDPATARVTAVIPVGGATLGIAVGAGRVWVARPGPGRGVVLRIDPRTDRVAGPPITVGPGPGPLAYGEGRVWVENTAPASLMRIDPTTARATTVLGPAVLSPGEPVAGAVAVGYGSLWVTANGYLERLDPRTNRIVANLRIPLANEIAVGAGAIWVLTEPRSTSATTLHPVRNTAELYQVSPRQDRAVGPPLDITATEPIALTATAKHVWVGDFPDTITELRLNRR
jgi:streptogramin lyase